MPAGEVKAGEAFIELRASMRKLRGDMARAQAMVQRTSAKIGAMARKTAMIGGAMAAPLALGTGAAADFETQMAELQKVSDAETMAEMRGEIREMARTMPMAHDELSTLAADAARFGIEGTKNLRNFTRTAGMMGTATDLAADRAGEALAKLAEITDTPISQMENVGSAVNELSNNFATSSSEIVEASLRSSAALSQLGLSQTQIFGLTASLNAVSASARRAGTRLRRVGQQLMNPKKVEDFAEALGMDVAEFKAMREEAPIDIILTMAKSLKEGNKTGEKLRGTLNSVSRQALAGLGQNFDSVQEALGMSNKAFEEATSLQREYNIQSNTTIARLKTLRNNLYDVGITIGNVMLPAVKQAINSLINAAGVVGDFISANKDLVKVWGAAAGGFLTLAAGAFTLQGALWVLSSVIGAVTLPLTALIGAVTGLSAIIGGIGSAFAAIASPITIAIGAITAVTVALLKFTRAGDLVSSAVSSIFGDLADIVEDTFGAMRNAIVGGDLKLAARIAMTSVKLEVMKVVSSIKSLWTGMIEKMMNTALDISLGLAKATNQGEKFLGWLKADFLTGIEKTVGAGQKAWATLGMALNNVTDPAKFKSRMKQISGMTDARIDKIWEQYRAQKEAGKSVLEIREWMVSKLKNLNKEQSDSMTSETEKSVRRMEASLAGMKVEAGIKEAFAGVDIGGALKSFFGIDILETIFGKKEKGIVSNIVADIKKAISETGEGIQTDMRMQAQGTFSATRLAGRFAGGEPIQKRQLEYMKQTAENTSRSARESEKQKTTYGA